MRTRKVSLTLDEDLLAEAREMVGPRGLSSYVNRALRRQLQHDRPAKAEAAPDRVPGSAKVSSQCWTTSTLPLRTFASIFEAASPSRFNR